MTPAIPLRILTIDDEPSIRRCTERFLTTLGGHIAASAGTGLAGLAKAREFRPDVILLDLGLPDMGGADVMAALLADPATCAIPVVVVTGSSLDKRELGVLASSGNFFGLAEKPVRIGKLLSLIEAAHLRAASGPGPAVKDFSAATGKRRKLCGY